MPPTDFGTFTLNLRDNNGAFLAGRTIKLKQSGVDKYTLSESSTKPGVYSNSNVQKGEEYDIEINGIIDSEYTAIPFGAGVEGDAIHILEHAVDQTGRHTDISVKSITWY